MAMRKEAKYRRGDEVYWAETGEEWNRGWYAVERVVSVQPAGMSIYLLSTGVEAFEFEITESWRKENK